MQINKCLGLLLPVMMTCAGADIVKQGKPCADIIISENADAGTILAAKDLQSHLHQISGARLAIVTPQKAKLPTRLCVGESSTSQKAGYRSPAFKGSGYDIWVKGSCVVLNGPVTLHKKTVISGKLHKNSTFALVSTPVESNPALKVSLSDDHGVMHAVSAFLEQLGVRFYAPYKNGTIIPKLQNVRIRDLRITREAAFARREFNIGSLQATDKEAVLWFKRLKTGSALPRVGVLAIADIVKAGQAQHPEWAAKDKQGNLLLTGDGCVHPRLTEKSLQKKIVEAAIKIFDANPELTGLHIVPPALRSGGDHNDLQRINPKTVYPFYADLSLSSGAYAEMARAIAKKYPDKKIFWQGFPGRSLPTDGDFPANLGVIPSGVSATAYAQSGSRKKYIAQLPNFGQLFQVKGLEQREWWSEYAMPTIPRQGYTFPRKLAEIRQAQQGIFAGFLMDAAVDEKTRKLAEVPLMHLMYYINSQLMWNPELGVSALLKEYCGLWFGPAAEEMYYFLNLLESISDRPGSRTINTEKSQLEPRDIPVIFEILDKAIAKTPARSIFRTRIQAIRKSLAGLKTVFARRNPRGRTIVGEIHPWDQKTDGNLSKYKKWQVLPAPKGAPRTEFAIACSEDRTRMIAAFRCFEPEMKKLKAAAAELDDCRILSDDHIRIDFNTPDKNAFLFAANSAGIFMDASDDPGELSQNGCFTGRDKERTFARAKRFKDRWELEVSVDITQCGKYPDWSPAWGLNITRVRTVSGKTEKFALVKNAENKPFRWRKFVIPRTDSKGNKTYFYNCRLDKLPGCKDEGFYTVKRAKGKVSISDPWDGKSWKNVPELRLRWEMWYFNRSSGFRPDARAKFQYDDKYLYVLYKVKDQYVRGTFKKDQQMVCLDSCMEFFVQPDPAGPYYNFESNSVGTLLLFEVHCYGDIKKMVPVSAEEMQQIKRFATLPRSLKGEIDKPTTWYLGLQIPIEMFVKRTGISPKLSGQVWHANVFKCADWTSHPCWLMWHKSATFHHPEGFGKFIFE